MKPYLLAVNHAYIFFCTSLYLGLFWSLNFFWFPSYRELQVDNYVDQIIPQTTAATEFFIPVISVMAVAVAVMLVFEWKTRFRWIPLLWIPALGGTVMVQQLLIEPVNDRLAAGVTSQAALLELLEQWMLLNQVRGGVLTVMWLVMMYYFVAKGDLLKHLSDAPKAPAKAMA